MIDIKTPVCLILIFKKLMQIPPIAYSPDYQMTERFDSETIANHPKNGIIKMERGGWRRGSEEGEGEAVMFS